MNPESKSVHKDLVFAFGQDGTVHVVGPCDSVESCRKMNLMIDKIKEGGAAANSASTQRSVLLHNLPASGLSLLSEWADSNSTPMSMLSDLEQTAETSSAFLRALGARGNFFNRVRNLFTSGSSKAARKAKEQHRAMILEELVRAQQALLNKGFAGAGVSETMLKQNIATLSAELNGNTDSSSTTDRVQNLKRLVGTMKQKLVVMERNHRRTEPSNDQRRKMAQITKCFGESLLSQRGYALNPKKLGSGAHGTVFMGKRLSDGTDIVVKLVPNTDEAAKEHGVPFYINKLVPGAAVQIYDCDFCVQTARYNTNELQMVAMLAMERLYDPPSPSLDSVFLKFVHDSITLYLDVFFAPGANVLVVNGRQIQMGVDQNDFKLCNVRRRKNSFDPVMIDFGQACSATSLVDPIAEQFGITQVSAIAIICWAGVDLFIRSFTTNRVDYCAPNKMFDVIRDYELLVKSYAVGNRALVSSLQRHLTRLGAITSANELRFLAGEKYREQLRQAKSSMVHFAPYLQPSMVTYMIANQLTMTTGCPDVKTALHEPLEYKKSIQTKAGRCNHLNVFMRNCAVDGVAANKFNLREVAETLLRADTDVMGEL